MTTLSAFLVILLAALSPEAPGTAPVPAPAAGEGLRIAVTIDDVPAGGRDLGLERLESMTRKLLDSLARQSVPAIGFVNESKLEQPGEAPARTALLESWLVAGMDLGNHTFSHPSLTATPVERYQEDIVRGETVTRGLLQRHGGSLRYFRYPFLRTGRTRESKKAVERFLDERGYRIAPVTVENSDYLFAAAYEMALRRQDPRLAARVADQYLEFTRSAFEFWEMVSARLLGRQVSHVLLLHANQLNADHFDRVADLIRGRGYRFVPLDAAMKDEAYEIADTYVGEMGISWLQRWAGTLGVTIDWKLEPEPPEEIFELFDQYRRNE